jgi:hypothetical protein
VSSVPATRAVLVAAVSLFRSRASLLLEILALREKNEILKLQEELDRLKGVGTVMPRKAWLRAVVGKVFDYLDKKVDLALKTGVETAARTTMIGPGGGQGSSSDAPHPLQYRPLTSWPLNTSWSLFAPQRTSSPALTRESPDA